MPERALTVAEANQQQFTIPKSLADNWRGFAIIIDGYIVVKDLKADTA